MLKFLLNYSTSSCSQGLYYALFVKQISKWYGSCYKLIALFREIYFAVIKLIYSSLAGSNAKVMDLISREHNLSKKKDHCKMFSRYT